MERNIGKQSPELIPEEMETVTGGAGGAMNYANIKCPKCGANYPTCRVKVEGSDLVITCGCRSCGYLWTERRPR